MTAIWSRQFCPSVSSYLNILSDDERSNTHFLDWEKTTETAMRQGQTDFLRMFSLVYEVCIQKILHLLEGISNIGSLFFCSVNVKLLPLQCSLQKNIELQTK